MYTGKFFLSNHASFYSKEQYLKYHKHTFINVEKTITDNILDLRSTTKKVLVALHPRMFHLLIDNLSLILQLNKKINNLEFILDDTDIPLNFYQEDYSKTNHQYFIFFLKVLKDHDIKYTIINNNQYETILINNFWFIRTATSSDELIQTLCDVFSEYIENKKITPYRNVYLSRVKTTTDSSLRTNNEIDVVDFFKKNNIEIIEAESFKNFEDQINYFNSVKTLIGFTGTGLLNMLFMQNYGNIIELTTPIKGNFFNPLNLTTTPGEELHPMYRSYAWSKKHLYTSVPNNFYYDSSLFLEYLNNFKILEKILYK